MMMWKRKLSFGDDYDEDNDEVDNDNNGGDDNDNIREIHPLDPQPHRYCMLASTASAPRVTRCSLGLYWSRDLCSKHALAGWGMSSYLGQIVRGSEI